MVAPFCGTAFGGLLYDMFLYADESPVNRPWMAFMGLLQCKHQDVIASQSQV